MDITGITLVGEEPTPPYHRPPLSKAYLKGEVDLPSMLIRPATFYEQNRITLKLGARVAAIDRTNGALELGSDEKLPYDRLVLASGSVHRPTDLDGSEHNPRVHRLRNHADAEVLARASVEAEHAILIGGGYIGLELAAVLRSRGLSVTLLHRGARVLSRSCAPEVASFFEAMHRAEGVDLHTGIQARSLTQRGLGIQVATGEGVVFEGASYMPKS